MLSQKYGNIFRRRSFFINFHCIHDGFFMVLNIPKWLINDPWQYFLNVFWNFDFFSASGPVDPISITKMPQQI